MAAVKQYHKLFGATSAYKRQLLVKIHVKSHRAPFKSKPPPAGRRFCFGQITPDRLVENDDRSILIERTGKHQLLILRVSTNYCKHGTVISAVNLVEYHRTVNRAGNPH